MGFGRQQLPLPFFASPSPPPRRPPSLSSAASTTKSASDLHFHPSKYSIVALPYPRAAILFVSGGSHGRSYSYQVSPPSLPLAPQSAKLATLSRHISHRPDILCHARLIAPLLSRRPAHNMLPPPVQRHSRTLPLQLEEEEAARPFRPNSISFR